MSEVSKSDTHEVRQCWGRLMHHTWQMNAGAYLLRTMCDYDGDDSSQNDYAMIVVCNGLLAATSRMMTDLDEFFSLLELTLPDWDEVKSKNDICEWALLGAIDASEKHARNGE